ncbi:MAG TPA: DUF5615 family PIN-like protein [Chloroflexia bacterium]|jgi:predicted nuclease of predicted toxin-antitoxin system
MKILLDENLPRRLRHQFANHDVATVTWLGWAGIVNGRLLDLAEGHSFEVFVTGDQSVPFQQNIGKRKIAVIVLVARDNQFETLEVLVPAVQEALETIQAGDVIQIGV